MKGNLYREDNEVERHLLQSNVELDEAIELVSRLDAKYIELENLSAEEILLIPRDTYLGAYDYAIFVTADGTEFEIYDGEAKEVKAR